MLIDNQRVVYIRLPSFADIKVHVERLAASAGSDAEEVGVVGHLHAAFLAGDVDAHGQALTVGVPCLEGCVLGVLEVLFEEEAEGCVVERQEEIIVRVERVSVAGEGVHEELQLVVGTLAGEDAALVELGLDEARHGGKLLGLAADKQVEVGVDKQLAVLGKEVQHGFDVGLGNLVAGVGHGAVALGLTLKLAEELSLLRNLDDLVVDDAVGIGNLAEEGQQVGGDDVAVDGDGLVGPDERWKVYLVHIDDVEGFYDLVAHPQAVVTGLEALHGEGTVLEVEGHEAVEVLVDLVLGELAMPDAALLEDVHDLAHLRVEVEPGLGVVLHEGGLHRFLGDDEVGADLGIGAAVEVAEVAAREELHVIGDGMVVALTAEDVLFLKGVALAEGLDDVVQHVGVGDVLHGIGGILLHGVLNLDDDGRITVLREEDRVHQLAIGILDVLELGEETVKRLVLGTHGDISFFTLFYFVLVISD